MANFDDIYRRPGTGRFKLPPTEQPTKLADDTQYLPYPHADSSGRPVWKVRFDLLEKPEIRFGLAINGELILGRRSSEKNVIDLGPFDATRMGVSRQHVKIQPTPTALYVIDLGSTNGTLRNGQSIGVNTPYALVNGDVLSMAGLNFIVRIIDRPSSLPTTMEQKADLADALSQVAKAITSQIELDEVLKQMLETARTLTYSGETSIWLVDERSGDLFLEAQRGSDEEDIRRVRMPGTDNTLAGQVFLSGKAIRASRRTGVLEEDFTLGSGPQIEALMYVPLKLGSATFGVLSAAHRQPGAKFNSRDERILMAIGDFASIAIANARLFRQLERERNTIHATIDVLPQPFFILDENHAILVQNSTAQNLLDHYAVELIEGLRQNLGSTFELRLGNDTYITSSEHVPEVGTIVVMQDISYVKHLEAARTEMLHALSHDLKSPLMSIRGWAYFLEKTTPIDEQGRDFVARIDSSVERMIEMISHLLNTAQMADFTELQISDCDLDGMVRQALTDVEGAALSKSVRLDYQISGTPFNVPGDASRLFHMFLNLIDNAIKYTIEGTNIYVALAYKPREVVFTVADEGPGIPENEIGRIFDKYYRGAQHKQGYTGVGLGLSVVSVVAKAHGGSVSARNRASGGAEFTVILPVT